MGKTHPKTTLEEALCKSQTCSAVLPFEFASCQIIWPLRTYSQWNNHSKIADKLLCLCLINN